MRPFAETGQQLGRYPLVECRDLDEATGLALRIPTLPVDGTIEVPRWSMPPDIEMG